MIEDEKRNDIPHIIIKTFYLAVEQSYFEFEETRLSFRINRLFEWFEIIIANININTLIVKVKRIINCWTYTVIQIP